MINLTRWFRILTCWFENSEIFTSWLGHPLSFSDIQNPRNIALTIAWKNFPDRLAKKMGPDFSRKNVLFEHDLT